MTIMNRINPDNIVMLLLLLLLSWAIYVAQIGGKKYIQILWRNQLKN